MPVSYTHLQKKQERNNRKGKQVDQPSHEEPLLGVNLSLGELSRQIPRGVSVPLLEAGVTL